MDLAPLKSAFLVVQNVVHLRYDGAKCSSIPGPPDSIPCGERCADPIQAHAEDPGAVLVVQERIPPVPARMLGLVEKRQAYLAKSTFSLSLLEQQGL